MQLIKYSCFSFLLLLSLQTLAQKTFSEGTLVYNISVQTGAKEPNMADMFDGATTTVYIKGNQSRSDMLSGLGSETTILDNKTGTGVILKDYSGQKLLISLSKEDWEKKNRKYEGIKFEPTNETAVIAGYNCKKAIARLEDGSSFVVYYTPDLISNNRDYDYQFKKLPGLALQYEWELGKKKFKYTLSKITFDNVPASKFDIPKSGYRVMSYEDTKR